MTYVLKPTRFASELSRDEKHPSSRIGLATEGLEINWAKLYSDVSDIERELLTLKRNIEDPEWLRAKLDEVLIKNLAGVKEE